MSNARSKRYIYNHRFTGEMRVLTKGQAKQLNEDWSKVQPAVNEKGERVLRVQMEGATIDISENKAPAEGSTDGERAAE